MTMEEMNDMSLFEGAADNADLLEKLLKASLIHADETYQTPPQIIWVDNSTIATLGNFSASTGKAKSRKTFNVSALVAASLANGKVLQYTAKLPDDKRKILYVDTEQSRFHCHSVMQRILRLAGLPDNMNSENLVFFGLREYSPNLRLRLIEYALQTQKGFGLVIIDGIRDLMLDINNPSESVHIINKLMQWSSRYDLHIHCVLHLNKGDDNVRGHIGTELSNKAETVLVISKSNSMANVSEVKPLNIRDKDFAPFAFQINKEGLPEIAKDYVVDSTTARQPKMTIADITDEQHDKALGMAFGKKVASGYENVINALTKGYTTIGFARGRTVMSKLLTFLLKSKLVVKCGNNEYCRMKDYKLTDYLSALGHQPKRCSKSTSYYLSPLHAETKPSFKVNFSRNQWYDFALGKGGNIIALAQLLYNTDDVGAALQHIAADMNNPKSTKAKPPIPTQVETDKMDKVHIQELSYPVLMSYLRSRHVDADIGKRYCKEIWYTFKGKRYFGIAFPNNRDGYELRNPYYKGCLGEKDISLIHSQQVGVQDRCCIFEGFMDFLSYKTLEKRGDNVICIQEPCDYIVLNSISSLGKCMERLACYTAIHCYLDNDQAGTVAAHTIMDCYQNRAINESIRYAEYKDVNDYLIGRKSIIPHKEDV